tara:strand:- start:4063 stop:6234 length:2172 start_codon:yes stop_codon:yes gene_type:complete
MAAIKKELVTNLIRAYEKQGLGGQQIMIKLLKRKDNVGKNMQALVDSYVEDGSSTPLEDAGQFFGINTSRAKGSRVAGEGSDNASIGDKLSSYGTSALMGVADSTAGIVQMNKQVGDKVNSVANSVLGTNLDTNAAADYNKQYQQANLATDGARSVGGRDGGDWVRGGAEIAATLPIYAAGRGATLGARMADQGVRGAAVGAAQYADSTDDRLLNMGVGAAGGAIGQGVGEKVGSAIGKGVTKAVNAKNGRLAPAYKGIDDLGKQFDVRTSVGDNTQGAFSKRAEVALEQVPVLGMGGFREAQAAEAKAATGKLTGKLKQAMSDTDYKALPTIRQAAVAGDRNAARVLNIVETAGDDTGRVLQASAEVRAFRESKIASRLYDKVDEAVAASGNDIVTPNKTKSLLDDAIKKQEASLAPDDVLLRELGEISKNLADPKKAKNFNNMRVLRSQLGDLAEKYGSPINGNKAASKVFANVRQAVDDDIADFALNSGNAAIKKAYKRADSFYKNAMKRSDKAIANAMKNNKPDEIYNAFVKTGKGDRANNFYQALDQKGQAALRYQMADEAISKATNESTGNFSPAKFAGEFERMSEPYGNIFKGDDKKQMDGLVKLMRHVERAGQYKENPPTGNRVIPWLVAGASTIDPTIAIRVIGASAFAKSMLTTRAGKNLLLAANKLPEAQQAALDNLLKSAAKVSAAAGAKTADAVAGTKVSDNDKGSLTSF